MAFLPKSPKTKFSPVGTVALSAFVLLLSGCGNHSPRPPLYLDGGSGAPGDGTAQPSSPWVDKTVEEEEKIISAALPGDVPNEEMSRESFIKLIEDAKSVVSPDTKNPKGATPSPAPAPTPTPSPEKVKQEPKPVIASPTPSPSVSPSPSPKLLEEKKKKTTTIWPSLNRKPKPEPKVETAPAPKPTPVPKPTPPPVTTVDTPVEPPDDTSDADDVGIDKEDEVAAEKYTGPKSVVDRPRSTPDFQLSEIAANLGAMETGKYRQIQKDAMGTSYRACNFFLITALVEAKLADENRLPLFMASLFDNKYFIPKGWTKITVEIMKDWFRQGKSFDVALQREAPKGKNHGHVAIPVGLNAQGQVMVAEGVYQKVSNRIRPYSDKEITTKFRVFARY